MKEITEEYKERISRLQKVLLENTSTLSDKLRSQIYTRFNNVRYFLLDSTDKYFMNDALAYFSIFDGNVYIMDKKYRVAEKNLSKQEEERLLATMPNPITDGVLLHEMIHAATFKKHNFFQKNSSVGYHYSKEHSSYGGDTKIIFHENKALNEGATEFYAKSFLKQETPNYIFFSQMYRILSDVCGYENLKETYFSGDIQKFKDEVKKSFHLKDDILIEKLLRQMDVVYTANENRHGLNYIPLVKNCFETLCKMQTNKIREEVKQSSKTDKEFAEKFKKEFDNFDIHDFIMKDCSFFARIWLEAISNRIKKNKKELLLEIPERKSSEQVLKNAVSDIVNSIKLKNSSQLIYYKNHLGDEKLDVLRLFNQPTYITHKGIKCNNAIAIVNFLRVLWDKNKKIDFKDFSQEDKFEFMSMVLFSPYEQLEKPYEYFYLKDIQDYLNNQEDTHTAFLDDLDAMEYIEPIVPNLNDKIKADKDFMQQYKIAKRDKEMKENEL